MILIESQYFPCLEYFSLIKDESEICIDPFEHFVKQTYRNRCQILTSNKVLSLSVPIRGANKKIPSGEILIDYSEDWIKDHKRSIISAYGKSPFFEYYQDHVMDLLDQRHDRLFDLNNEILSFCLKVLQIDVNISYSEKYIESSNPDYRDCRSLIHPKISHIHRKIYQMKEYTQTFGNKFASNLSILDLIFCCGPDAIKYI